MDQEDTQEILRTDGTEWNNILMALFNQIQSGINGEQKKAIPYVNMIAFNHEC